MVKQRLTQLLKDNFDAIIDTWVNTLHHSVSHYRSRPLEELKKTTGEHLRGIIEVFERGSYKRLESFIDEIAPFRSSLKFRLSATQRAFLVGKETILSILEKEFKEGDRALLPLLREIDECFNRAIFRYSDIYQKIQIAEAKKRSKALARAEEKAKYLQKLRQENKKLDDIVSGIGAGLSLIDTTMRIAWINKTLADEYGALEVVKGRYCYDLFWGKEELCANCPGRRTFESKNIERSLIRVTQRNRGTRYYQAVTAPIKDSQGHVRQVLELIQDITEMKELKAKVDSQQQFLAAITNSSADAIIGLDSNDIITSWNIGAKIIFGYTKEEVLGRPFDMLVPEDIKRTGELKWISKKIREQGYVRSYETERVTKDGKRVVVELTRTAIKDDNGQIIGSSAVIRDMSERKRLEEQLLHSERLATIGKMAARVAHEIKNPLSSISLNTELLEDEIRSLRGAHALEAESLLKSISSELERLNQVTEEYLQFSRLPKPKFKLENVNAVVEDVLEFLQNEFFLNGVHVEKNLGDGIPPLYMDKGQFRQGLLNILKNSLEAMPKGGKIRVVTELEGSDILIHISDSGEGIEEENLRRIFDPFYTTKDVGTGLGLPLTQQIVREHKGTLSCTSAVGKGTTFTIRLPVDSRGKEFND